MRIAVLHTRYRSHGGEDSLVDDLILQLTTGGHTVDAILAENRSGQVGAAVQLLASTHNARSAREVAERISDFQPDVTHVHNTWFAQSRSVVSAVSRLGVPTVQTIHNYRLRCMNGLLLRNGAACELCLEGSSFHGVLHRCYRQSTSQSVLAAASIASDRTFRPIARNTDILHFFSPWSRAAFLDSLKFPLSRTSIVPNFVGDFGSRSLPPSESDIVVYAGRLSAEKGVDILIDAWSEANLPLKLVLAGDGPDAARLRDLANGDASVSFRGQISRRELQDLLMSARAAVFPSRWPEGQPISLLEALNAGLPVIVTGPGGMSDVLAGTGAGAVVRQSDPNDLARAIRMLAVDDYVNRCGEFARQAYTSRYSTSVVMPQIISMYTRAVSERTAADR